MGKAGYIQDQKTAQQCSLSGLSVMKGREIELHQLRSALIANIREADAATSEADFWRHGLFALQLIKATCDAALGIVGALAEGPVKHVSTAYSGLTPAASALGKTIAGDKVGAGEWVKAGAAGANAAVKSSKLGGELKDVLELQKIKSDILVDATKGDVASLKKDLLSYAEKLAKMSAAALKQKTVGKVWDVSKQLVKAAQSYADAYQEMKSGDIANSMEYAKRQFRGHQAIAERQILALQKAISDCELQLVEEGKLKLEPPKFSATDALRTFTPSFPTIRAR